jgi:hypothetical protein
MQSVTERGTSCMQSGTRDIVRLRTSLSKMQDIKSINKSSKHRKHNMEGGKVNRRSGNVYPLRGADDRVGRNKKRKDNGKLFFRRDCIRKFSYHETFLCYLSSEEILE